MQTIFKLSLAKLQSLHFQVLRCTEPWPPMLLLRDRSGLLTISDSLMSLKSFLLDFSSLAFFIESWTGVLLTLSLLDEPQIEQIFTSMVCLLKQTMHVHLDMVPLINKKKENIVIYTLGSSRKFKFIESDGKF